MFKFKSTLKLLKPHILLSIIALLLACIATFASLLIPIYVGDIIDVIVGVNNVDYTIIFNNAIKIAICALLFLIFQYLFALICNHIIYKITYDLRKDCFDKIQRVPVSYLDSKQPGDILSRITNDVETFGEGLLASFLQLFTGFVTIIITFILVLRISWIIALFLFVVTPISLFVARFVSARIYKYFSAQSKIRGKQNAFIDEAIDNIKVVKAFNQEENMQEKFDVINNELKDVSMKATFYSSLVNPTTRFVNSIIYAGVIVISAKLILDTGSDLTIGALATLLAYASQYSKPFNDISEVISELANSSACLARINDFLDAKEMDEGKETIKTISSEGNIVFNKVYFTYDANKKLLENVNFDVKKGEHFAIVGPTGCGKTTLINLLLRYYDPNEGNIMFDDIDTTTINKHALRSQIGMVLQDTWLKNDTIMENLRFGNKNASDEDVIEAAKAAHAHEFIMQLKDGYQTVIGNGDSLSAGQRQLLCITRVMLAKPPILILDEATSSIDTRTELMISDAFHNLMSGKTSFIVAHRLSTIRNADNILVMKDGNIIETGTHQELLEKKGFYYSLYNSQFEQ